MAFSRRITPLLLFVMLSALLVSIEAISIKCGVCEESRCPELHYCEGEAVKDHCGCCTVCSSSKYQPHPLITSVQRQGSACEQVKCPKFKVCVENMQGLPLCTCPSQYICRRRKQRPVCGTDGNTYESRCHLRIAACNSGYRIKVDRKGLCREVEGDGKGEGSGVSTARNCDSASTCQRRKQRMVCGTDGRTYASRCLMKVAACQQGVKTKVKSQGPCPSRSEVTSNNGPSPIAADDDTDISGRSRRRRQRKKPKNEVSESDADPSGSDESRKARRQRRRERRKRKKEKQEKRRKRRKTRVKSRGRRNKVQKDRFQRTFGHYTWRY